MLERSEVRNASHLCNSQISSYGKVVMSMVCNWELIILVLMNLRISLYALLQEFYLEIEA